MTGQRISYSPSDSNWVDKVRQSLNRQSFMTLLDVRIVSLQPGYCELQLEDREDLHQQDGYVHAGVTSALADTAAGYAAFSLMPTRSSVLTTEFKILLLAPAKGERLLAAGRVEKAGRTLTIVSCDVFAAQADRRTRVAMFVGTMMCLQSADVEANAQRLRGAESP